MANASIIADKAPFTENPSSTDCFNPFFLNNPSLILLHCDYNNLYSLDLRNGNNHNFRLANIPT